MSKIQFAHFALPFAIALGAVSASAARAGDELAASCCRATWGTSEGATYRSKGTGYYPDGSSMEGGYSDRRGNPLKTLQGVLRGSNQWASTAMDANAFAYGTKICIPEINDRYGHAIPFKVVDTGGAFKGKGTSRIDICTASQSASLDTVINGRLTIVVCK